MGKSKINRYYVPKSGNQEEWIDNALEMFNLEGIRISFDKLANRMTQNNATLYDFLESLLEKELTFKEENRQQRWIQQAHFPWIKTIADFDFSFQPKLNQRLIHEFVTCRFIDKKENIIFLGPPGVGKTHLSIALGIDAIREGNEVRFLTLAELIELADKTEDDALLRHRLFNTLLRPKLLILDEMDFHETNPISGTFLFKLLQNRYEKGSIIFTSNKPFSEWEKTFNNKTRAGAAIDRLLHHATIVPIEGESYRVKEKLQKLSKKN